MKITFVLPGIHSVPSGGVKIVYEYANQLSALGHSINVVHMANSAIVAGMFIKIRLLARFVKKSLTKDYGVRSWFDVDPRVNVCWVPDLSSHYIPQADVVIATAWQTAEWVTDYPDSMGCKFYFIQHQETWSGPEERVMATWKLPLHKIVISRWLQDIAVQMDETADYIPNGLDFDIFGMDTPPETRTPESVMMLYHNATWKGVQEGLAALYEVKKKYSKLKLILFGVPDKPTDLPDWIEYYQQPSQEQLRKLYNKAAIFLAPSRSEGWGLTGSEAMMCGSAVVATDIGGHKEFAKHNETALMVETKNINAIANAVLHLIDDHVLRKQLADSGNKNIQKFTWGNSVMTFISVLSSVEQC